MAAWTFHSAGAIHFGRGVGRTLGDILEQKKWKRVFIVTDAVIEKLSPYATTMDALKGFDIATYANMQPEAPEHLVLEALAAAQSFAPDVILGLGGGSNMDAAKMVAVCLKHGGTPSDYAGDCVVPGSIGPLVCLPTTAGTGSEVSPAAVFTESKRGIKVSCLSPHIRPAVAVVDPAFTDECPKKLTADSGIDALTHAIEAYMAVDHEEFLTRPPSGPTVYQAHNKMSEAMALECIRAGSMTLDNAVHIGGTFYRDEMAYSALCGGLAFSNAGVALVHAMEYPLGAAVHSTHGAGNGLLLPHVMEFNRDTRPEAIFDLELHWNNLFDDDIIKSIKRLAKSIGIPTRLRDIGVTEAMLPGFADTAFGIKRLLRVNPRYPTRDEILAIYREAW